MFYFDVMVLTVRWGGVGWEWGEVAHLLSRAGPIWGILRCIAISLLLETPSWVKS